MMKDAVAHFATSQCGGLQGGAHQGGIITLGDAPSHDAMRAQIQHRGQVAPAFVDAQVGRVGDPDLVTVPGLA